MHFELPDDLRILQGRVLLDYALEHVSARETFGRKLRDHQGIEWQIADMASALHAARLVAYALTRQHILDLLENVKDPEVPVISVRELGVLRDVGVNSGKVLVTITPTYTGCPAMDTMREDIVKELHHAGIMEVEW